MKRSRSGCGRRPDSTYARASGDLLKLLVKLRRANLVGLSMLTFDLTRPQQSAVARGRPASQGPDAHLLSYFAEELIA